MGKARKIIAALILLPLGIIIPFLSLESHYAAPSQAQSQTRTQDQDAALAKRIKEYKAAYKEKVEESDAQRIRLRCEAAQENAKNLVTRITAVQKKRNAAYSKIAGQLTNLVAKLDAQAYETTAIKENLATLKAKTDAFKTYMAGYTQALSDLTELDCKKDPTAFLATLKIARTNQAKLVPLVGDIRSYIVNTVKPTLQQIRSQIEKGQTTGGSL